MPAITPDSVSIGGSSLPLTVTDSDDLANVQRDVHRVILFSDDSYVVQNLAFETGLFDRNRVETRRQAADRIDAVRVGCAYLHQPGVFCSDRDGGVRNRGALGIENCSLNSGAVLGVSCEANEKQESESNDAA